MLKIQLQIDETFLQTINDNLNLISDKPELVNLSANDMAREALAVYKWVVEQTAKGRAVVAADKELRNLIQMSTPSLPAKDPTV